MPDSATLDLALNEPSFLDWAHPIVREWFVKSFGTPTEPQELGWPHILAGETTLICAPTGSGKTLTAFLACIDQLVRKSLSGALVDQTEVVYVSPLKALSNDIRKNLEAPLAEIYRLANERGYLMPEIRTAVRTGDTLASDRRLMLHRPPHILVTTPESLYILLTTASSRETLRTVHTVIVDEIHALADDKRGSHLALSLERLDALTGRQCARIGLSATQKPIARIAEFLTGEGRPKPVIVQVPNKRRLDLAVEVPSSELGPVASNEMWEEIYARIAQLVTEHRSTLIFVNTRRLAERLAHHLRALLGEEAVAAHHGSLSRQIRLAVETKLKNGELRALVATASLELGIDIGSVDLACQIGSPRSISVFMQRVGRAGHWRGAIPKGRLFATTRDELLECAALVRSVRRGDLDEIIIPENSLDILAQQIVAACAAEEWDENALFDLVRRAYPYRNLPRSEYDAVLEMLSEGIASRRGRKSAYIHRDRVNGRLRGRRGARIAAITSGGAIPETGLYPVIAEPEQVTVGSVDEDFAVESLRGDIFLLGNTSWRIRSVRGGAVQVEDAHGAPPNVPFWRGEAPGRTIELSQSLAEVRQTVSAYIPSRDPAVVAQKTPEVLDAINWLKTECALDDSGAEQAVEYIVTGRAVLTTVPTQHTVIAERFFDEGGGMQLVIHSPFGARINKAWGLALRKRFCRSFNFELQAAATDNGINIALGEVHSFPLTDVFDYLHSNSVAHVLEQAVLDSPIFATRWRWAANRSLALLRFVGGKKVPPQLQRMRSDDLLSGVFPEALACQENIKGDIEVPDHPLAREAMHDAMTEAMDIDGLIALLRQIEAHKIQCIAVNTPVPSQFSHEILNANPYAYLDDAPLEERRSRAVEMRRVLPESVLTEVGGLDPAAIAEVRAQAWPDVRDADELHDALYSLVAVPEILDLANFPLLVPGEPLSNWNSYFPRLIEANRARIAAVGDRQYWVATERARAFLAIFPEARFASPLPSIDLPDISREDALFTMLTGWFGHTGPVNAPLLSDALGIPVSEIDKALLRLEATGSILRGKFTSAAANLAHGQTEWCERRLLARIHRLTVGRLRSEIQPVNAAQFMRWLLRWQHLSEGAKAFGERGTLDVLKQLQGYEASATAWEKHILPSRIANYDPKVLDRLCLTGAIGWGRLSPHAATLEEQDGSIRRRIVPTSSAPITFFVRDDSEWMAQRRSVATQEFRALSPVAHDVLAFLRQRGASFFPDIVRATGKLKSEVETGLWELVAAGIITADGFDNLRALIDPRRRAGHGSARGARPRHSSGRWSLLYNDDSVEHEKMLESVCRMLLRRYGVIFRDLLQRESNLPRWREVLVMLRRLEDRGEIRGGRFVSGFLGEQFALPEAVESLRAIRKREPSNENVAISAADPLNLVGIVVPGDRVNAASGRLVHFRDGVAVEHHPASFDVLGFAAS